MILLIHHPPDRPHHTDLTGALAAANEQATDQEEREGMETAPHHGLRGAASVTYDDSLFLFFHDDKLRTPSTPPLPARLAVIYDSLFLFSMKFYKILFRNSQL